MKNLFAAVALFAAFSANAAVPMNELPEPGSLALAGLALVVAVGVSRRKG